MASIAMFVGGAMVNALAFSWSNYLFSMLRSSDLNKERKRHDQGVEQLQAKWSRKRTQRLDWISKDLRRQGHNFQTFRDVDDAMREYSWDTTAQQSLASQRDMPEQWQDGDWGQPPEA